MSTPHSGASPPKKRRVKKTDDQPREVVIEMQRAAETAMQNHDGLRASYSGLDDRSRDVIHDMAMDIRASIDSALRASSGSLKQSSGSLKKSAVLGKSPFDQDTLLNDPRLDPKSDTFDSSLWVRNIKAMYDSNPERFKPTSLGVAFKGLRAYGQASDADYQTTALNVIPKVIGQVWDKIANRGDESRFFDILKPMTGMLRRGTVTVVLGRPGAGCTTFLKTIAAQTHGFHVGKESVISYDGLRPKDIKNRHRGDVTYSAESDVHFPHLTVGQTLNFATSMRVPQNRPEGVSREQFTEHVVSVVMALYGISHTYNTKVGNDLVRGVSGGERKRVSIAEVSLCGSYLQCWDNATRGLDSATALEFIRALRTSADTMDITSVIAIYQCSQDAYDLFDDVILLYEGYQIYSGPANKAKAFFIKMGYECPPRQTTADFLTSLTSPAERVVRKGYARKVPRTPKQFYDYWVASKQAKKLEKKVDDYISEHNTNSSVQEFHEAHRARQADHTRSSSPYTVSFWMQMRGLVKRNFWRMKSAPQVVLTQVCAQIAMALILSSLFYNLPFNSSSFFNRGAALFLCVLFNSFSSLLEIMALFESRSIVEKHKQYALYRPAADALASITLELVPKIIISICFNIIYYFMVNFRRNAGNFFFYLLMNFTVTLAMSHMFRTIGSLTTTLPEAMAPASIVLLGLSMYAGFSIPTTTMHKWSRWMNYIDPVAYVFEALMANEFHNRQFPCSEYVPHGGAYDAVDIAHKVCSVASSIPGAATVDGDRYLAVTYAYYWGHRWRNFGILLGFVFFFLITYLLACELNKGAMQNGEVTLFPRSKLSKIRKQKKKEKERLDDIENGGTDAAVAALAESQSTIQSDVDKVYAGTDIYHWRDLCYDVQIGSETRRILNHVNGWIKPGTLTALMGASGAGKTTLLDVLAARVTMGTIYGHMFVNGNPRDTSFQRSTGYAQQQDLHLQTSTVREALRFSAYLRQPSSVSKKEKDEYVESVITILEMTAYADAVVGEPGEGLNVEQRKRLTIGVELAAKPKLLLFLDEPTSGLDSQTAWSVCQLMRKLADNGQAILCTIHQPSAVLMQEFDRLLFMARGGRTVYFGDLGNNCKKLIKYFESNGAPPCPPEANPAEWMLTVIGAAPGSHANQDYHEVWKASKECRKVKEELARMEVELAALPREDSSEAKREFAASLFTQYLIVTQRVFEQYYRSPSYVWAKILLGVISALYNGFTFYNAGNSLQGLQNQMLSSFLFLVVLNPLVQQMMPKFVEQRALYEARERPSKTFSWVAFIAAQITVELPWNIFVGTLAFLCWYFPVGLFRNGAASATSAERGGLAYLYVVSFYLFIGTIGQAAVAAVEVAEIGGTIANLCFTMALNFCGVLKYPTNWWIWMYYISPFTYYVSGLLATVLAKSKITCRPTEYIQMLPPVNSTCGEYLSDYTSTVGGYVLNPDTMAPGSCTFCTMSDSDVFLDGIHSHWKYRWRNWGIFFCYIWINVIICVFLYWLVRVPKGNTQVKAKESEAEEPKVATGPTIDEEPDDNAAELTPMPTITEPPKKKKKRTKKTPEPTNDAGEDDEDEVPKKHQIPVEAPKAVFELPPQPASSSPAPIAVATAAPANKSKPKKKPVKEPSSSEFSSESSSESSSDLSPQNSEEESEQMLTARGEK